MVFSSAIFISLFLPLFLGIYYLAPKRAKSIVILLGSYTFYAWWRVDFMLLFAVVTLFNYYASVKIHKNRKKKIRKRWLTVGVTGNLVVLGFFKYANFGVDSLNIVLNAAGIPSFDLMKVILPIGISFYIFQAISYLIDIYRRDAKPAKSFADFAAFIALFPQLIAGPVLRYKDVAEQFTKRTHSLDKFNEGALRFALGFCKKVMIADSVAPLADTMFALENPTFFEAWLGVLAYTIQLYFDFSGYSDMAIGLGLMMGFRFIENFNQPYISRSITEFWNRWHISLSTWLRDYLYIPLGGNRKGARRTYINLMLTMVLGGLWHGANWTFILWGLWHGLILAIERKFSGKKHSPYPRNLALPITLLFVMIGWVLFRSTDVSQAFAIYQGMLGMNGFWISDVTAWQITPFYTSMVAIGWIIVFMVPYCQAQQQQYGYIGRSWVGELSIPKQVLVMLVFILSYAKLISQSHSPFLYFQF